MTLRPHVLILPFVLAACGHPRQLQYDFGRAYEASLATQSDLARPNAADAAYPLSGVEGIALRTLATESSTDQESANPDSVKNIAVQ
jgi:hypothetical protein